MEGVKVNQLRSRGRPCKYPVVKQRLRNAILNGDLKVGQQLPPALEVAERLGVANLTAKRAIDELVKEGWLTTRRGIGTFVGVRKSASQILLTAPRSAAWQTFLKPECLDSFHEAFPNVRITLSADEPTDFWVGGSYGLVVGCLQDKRRLPLEELQHQLGVNPWALPDSLRSMASFDGKLYGLPMRLSLSLLQLNPQLLQRRGIHPPDRYMDRDTFRQVLERCHVDGDGDGVAECFGTFSSADLGEWLVPFWQNGGRLDDREAFFQAFSVFDELWRLHHAERILPIELHAAEGELTNRKIHRRFVQGQIAMRWIETYGIFERIPFSTSLVWPQFGPLPRQHAEMQLIGINRTCAHPEAALQFLQFCYERFIRDNPQYPFALGRDERETLQGLPQLHRFLNEGADRSSEALREGVPQRTWAIERDLYEWFQLLVDRKTLMDRLNRRWEHDVVPAHGEAAQEGDRKSV